jgi:hypothetical protein
VLKSTWNILQSLASDTMSAVTSVSAVPARPDVSHD